MIISAAEQENMIIWIMLEIGTFGTFLSFLKLGYFAFLREGTIEAKDPPLTMKIAMLSAAALCVAIGIYPPLLYSILPNGGSGYNAYNANTLLTSSIVLGAAALTFFTVGRKYLAPHETRLHDFDVGYVALGHGVMAFGRELQGAFGAVYGFITGRLVPGFSKLAGRMQTGLLSINGLFMLGALIIVLLAVAFWGL